MNWCKLRDFRCMQTRDECPVTTAYQVPLYPYNVHSSHLFQQGKDRHEPLRRKTFWEHFLRQALAEKKYWTPTTNWHFGQKVKETFSEFQYWPVIVVFQSYSEADKFKHIVNIAMPFWEKASCLHRCYASPLLLVTIAPSRMVAGWSREWAGGCKVMSGPGHLELLLSLTSYRDHPGHKQMFCIVFKFPYWYPARLQSWMKLQMTMKSFSSPPSSTLTNCSTKMASTRRRKKARPVQWRKRVGDGLGVWSDSLGSDLVRLRVSSATSV